MIYVSDFHIGAVLMMSM